MFIFSAKIYTVCILFLKKYNAPGTLPFTFFVNIFKLKKTHKIHKTICNISAEK